MFAKKLTQESKKCPAAIRFRFFPWYRRDGLHVLSYNHTDTGACRAARRFIFWLAVDGVGRRGPDFYVHLSVF